MTRINTSFSACLILAVCWPALHADDWTRFLGPNGSGIAAGKAVPSNWSLTENMQWKVELPGYGSSSPIVVGDKVLVTCYSGYGLDTQQPGDIKNLVRSLVCFDAASGKQLWKSDVAASPDEDPYKGFITEHGYASSTPTSDGQHVFCFFGKTGVVAFDLEGKQLWTKNLGNFSDPAKWGDGSSPILVGDLLIVNAGIVGHKIVALRKDTGEQVWQVENDGFTNTWSTPVLADVDGHTELVFSIPQKIFALDPATGKELWFAQSPITNTVCPSLAHADGVVFAMGGRGGQGIAVRCGGQGDVSGTHTVWQAPLQAGIGTPIAVQGRLIWSSRGIVTCADCSTGAEVYKERIGAAEQPGQRRGPAGDYASALTSGDQIIVIPRNGQAVVLRAGDRFEKIGAGSFGDDPGPFNATPAISDGKLFVRTNRALYCIGN